MAKGHGRRHCGRKTGEDRIGSSGRKKGKEETEI